MNQITFLNTQINEAMERLHITENEGERVMIQAEIRAFEQMKGMYYRMIGEAVE